MKKIRVEMELPEEVWRKCTVQAAEAGITFDKMLQQFVTDLGDNKRPCYIRAARWMEYCTLLMSAEASFLRHLEACGNVQEVLNLHYSIQDLLLDLKDNGPLEQIVIREDIAYYSDQLRRYFGDYECYHAHPEHRADKTLAAGMARVLAWSKRKWELVKQQGAERP